MKNDRKTRKNVRHCRGTLQNQGMIHIPLSMADPLPGVKRDKRPLCDQMR